MRRWRTASVAVALAFAAVAVPVAARAAGPAAAPACATGSDWAQYGRTAARTFDVAPSCSGISTATVPTLVPKWFFHTHDSVTASPAVVGDTAYVGSWDGRFYAINTATGAARWTYDITTTTTVAFGKIPSSAAVVRFPDATTGRSRLVVLFGGGSWMWALDAATGKLLAKIDLDPRAPELRAKQAANPPVAEIESSPVVATVRGPRGPRTLVYVGMDVHNDAGVGPAGLVALELRSSPAGWAWSPVWKHDPETDRTYTGPAGLTAGSGTGQGCGDVWSSPAVDPGSNTVVYGVGNCDHVAAARAAGLHWSEAMVAVRADTGRTLWRFQPAAQLPTRAEQDQEASADLDFGASPQIFTLADGHKVVGEGQKSAIYWVRDLRTGAPVWHTLAGTPGNLQENFAVGGFIGSTAVQRDASGRAVRVVGGTAIPFPQTADQVASTLWAVRGLSAAKGAMQWTYQLGGPTYAATSVVNGVAFVPETVSSDLIALDAATGLPLWVAPVIGPPSSTAVVAGDSVYLGTGTRETDLEYKAVGLELQKSFTDTIGESPLSPLSGVQAWTLASGAGSGSVPPHR
ncbi:MAG TPA: PQQ-binding-like beta-propeller repeat protein [Acidimicrobiales bacterium]|nr:PQQ-binding-like beta-propeller repeat protein [Acidimicrobiales bacterium]